MKSPYCILYSLVLIAGISSGGCTYIDSMLQSFSRPSVTDESASPVEFEEARAALKSGEFERAGQLFQEYVQKNERGGSNNNLSLAYANAQLGLIAFNKDQFLKSNQYFEESLRLDPTNLEVIGTYGDTLLKQADQTQGADALYLKAEALFAQAIQMAPNDKRFQISYGRSLASQKKYQLGLRYLKQALGEQNAYEEMAHIYHLHMEYDKAALAMTKAHEIHTKKQMLASRQQRSGNTNPSTQNASQQTGGYAVSQPRPDTDIPNQITQDATDAFDPRYQMTANQIPVAQNFQGQNYQGQVPQQQSSSQPMTPLQQIVRQQQNANVQQTIVQQPAMPPQVAQPPMAQQSWASGYQEPAQPPYANNISPGNTIPENVNSHIDGFASSTPTNLHLQNAKPQQAVQQPAVSQYQITSQPSNAPQLPMQPQQPVMQPPIVPQQQMRQPITPSHQPPYGFAGQMPPATSGIPGQASPFVADSQEIAYRQNRQPDQNTNPSSTVNPLADQAKNADVTSVNATTGAASNAFPFSAFPTGQSSSSTGQASIGAVTTGSANSATTPTFSGFQAF